MCPLQSICYLLWNSWSFQALVSRSQLNLFLPIFVFFFLYQTSFLASTQASLWICIRVTNGKTMTLHSDQQPTNQPNSSSLWCWFVGLDQQQTAATIFASSRNEFVGGGPNLRGGEQKGESRICNALSTFHLIHKWWVVYFGINLIVIMSYKMVEIQGLSVSVAVC